MKNDFGINTDLFTFVLRVKLKEKTCLCSLDRTVRLYDITSDFIRKRMRAYDAEFLCGNVPFHQVWRGVRGNPNH